MILSDREIGAALENGLIVIKPRPSPELWTSTAIDLTLDNTVMKWLEPEPEPTGKHQGPREVWPLSANFNIKKMMEQPGYAQKIEIPERGYPLDPCHFILGYTHESIYLPQSSRIAARVEGKSSLARLGVGIHVTAPTIHAGFGYNTDAPGSPGSPIQLEIFNLGVFRVYLQAGMPICQLILEEVREAPSKGYLGQFSAQQSFKNRASEEEPKEKAVMSPLVGTGNQPFSRPHPMVSTVRFPRVRFSVRALMLAVAAFAGLFGIIYGYFVGPIRVEAETVRVVEHMGGRVSRTIDNHPAWLKRALQGQDQKPVVIVHLEGTNVSDSDLLCLKGFPKLGGLYLNRTPITDAALATIDGMDELQDLDLSNTQITSLRLKGLAKLQELKLASAPVESVQLLGFASLGLLDLSGTKIDDADMDDLTGITTLQTLKLRDTAITDAGIARLKAMPKLRSVWLQGTRVTQEGINQLKQARPGLAVFQW